MFEEPYFGGIVEKASFDQIYDEHVFLFSAGSGGRIAARYGFDLVDVERFPVHGGEIRYTLAKCGARASAPAIAELLSGEAAAALSEKATLLDFADRVDRTCEELVALLPEVVDRLIIAGHHTQGDPGILIVMDTGYDVTRLAFALADLPVQLMGPIRSDRVMLRPAPPRVPGALGCPRKQRRGGRCKIK